MHTRSERLRGIGAMRQHTTALVPHPSPGTGTAQVRHTVGRSCRTVTLYHVAALRRSTPPTSRRHPTMPCCEHQCSSVNGRVVTLRMTCRRPPRRCHSHTAARYRMDAALLPCCRLQCPPSPRHGPARRHRALVQAPIRICVGSTAAVEEGEEASVALAVALVEAEVSARRPCSLCPSRPVGGTSLT